MVDAQQAVADSAAQLGMARRIAAVLGHAVDAVEEARRHDRFADAVEQAVRESRRGG